MSAAAAPETRPARGPRPGHPSVGRPLTYAPPGYRARLRATLHRVAGSSGRGWQAKAARAVGVSGNTVCMWATGERMPSLTVLVRVSGAAGVNLHWLLTGKGPIAAPGDAP